MALAKLDLDALTVADAVADVAAMAGDNVTTAIRADLKELRTETNVRLDTLTSEMRARFGTFTSQTSARLDTLAGAILSLQREMSTLRWMIGIGFTLLSALAAILTFFRAGAE